MILIILNKLIIINYIYKFKLFYFRILTNFIIKNFFYLDLYRFTINSIKLISEFDKYKYLSAFSLIYIIYILSFKLIISF